MKGPFFFGRSSLTERKTESYTNTAHTLLTSTSSIECRYSRFKLQLTINRPHIGPLSLVRSTNFVSFNYVTNECIYYLLTIRFPLTVSWRGRGSPVVNVYDNCEDPDLPVSSFLIRGSSTSTLDFNVGSRRTFLDPRSPTTDYPRTRCMSSPS